MQTAAKITIRFQPGMILTAICILVSMYSMYKVKRITANIPAELLMAAIQVTQSNLTDTLIHGLKLIRRSNAYEKARVLKNKLHLKLDLDVSRERSRR